MWNVVFELGTPGSFSVLVGSEPRKHINPRYSTVPKLIHHTVLKMTINHVFVWGSAAKFVALRSFYRTVLQPIGYNEMICVNNDALIGYGSDYPYFWLKKLPEGKDTLPTHIAFDAPSMYVSV
jgi:hypothetical protein